jgi:hypothetical protein
MPQKVVLDANLLLLWIVGSTGRHLIARHRRLHPAYQPGHFDLLLDLLGPFEAVVVAPHALAELWNLIGEDKAGKDTVRAAIIATARSAIGTFIEVHHPAKDLVARDDIGWLGLSDVAQLSVAAKAGHVLLSVDGPLCYRAAQLGITAVSFWGVADQSS